MPIPTYGTADGQTILGRMATEQEIICRVQNEAAVAYIAGQPREH